MTARLPDPQTHLDHAAHNERLLDILENQILDRYPEFLDWAIIVTFYAALHYTKAVLIRDHSMVARTHRGPRDERAISYTLATRSRPRLPTARSQHGLPRTV